MSHKQIVIAQFMAIVLFVFLVEKGFSIKCWRCVSSQDGKCGKNFDNSSFSIVDCAHEKPLEHLSNVKATMCKKISQKVYGNWQYYRDCAYLGEPGINGDERHCLMRTGTYNVFMEYCTCNSKDGCNKASGKQCNIFLLCTGTVLVLIKMLFFTS